MLSILVYTEVSAATLAVKMKWCERNLESPRKKQSLISSYNRQSRASSLISSQHSSSCWSTASTLASRYCPSCTVSSPIQTVLPSPPAYPKHCKQNTVTSTTGKIFTDQQHFGDFVYEKPNIMVSVAPK